jgi:hypothetical protein
MQKAPERACIQSVTRSHSTDSEADVWRAAALFVLPESPRWLVVSGNLDEALAVIHRIYTSAGLQIGGLPL